MVEIREIIITPYNLKRRAFIYLPKDYAKSNKRYPVIYMYDGHNLFADKDATYGRAWRLDKYLSKHDDNYIIASVECNHEGNKRLEEYCPYPNVDFKSMVIDGTGKQYMDWLTTEFKEYIDNNYRTLKDRDNTMIAGSSMGGLMSFYSIINYNKIFSKAACLSSTLFICYPQLMEDLAKQDIDPNTKIYLDYGGKEVNEEQLKNILYLHEAFKSQLENKKCKVMFYLDEKGKHNEAFWEKRIPLFLNYLWDKEK